MQVDLLDYLDKRNILLKIKGRSKKSILTFLVDNLISTKKIDKGCKKEVIKALLHREEMGSTAIGGGIALPHARLEGIKRVTLCIGISKEGVDFDSLDGEPVHVIVLLLSNQKEAGLHLKSLAFLARILKDKNFVRRLTTVTTPDEVISLLQRQLVLIR